MDVYIAYIAGIFTGALGWAAYMRGQRRVPIRRVKPRPPSRDAFIN